MAKKVIYLFGAGASQAVIKDIDPDKSIMTIDIQDKIEKKYSKKGISDIIWNELISPGTDIEHLISILESQYNFSTSNKLRNYYRTALVELTKELPKPDSITLYTVLSDLHLNIISNLPDNADLEEELLCFITLNYEDILERSIKNQLKCEIDYIIEKVKPVSKGNRINLIKLHGSFNWTNSCPIQVKSMSSLVKTGNALWIPPGVEKRKDNYPFNLLWGRAMEFLMKCDILRIIGCSLSFNDWGLIPILYTVQRFMDINKIEIEIINYLDTAKNIEKNYSYLNVKRITELPELKYYYKNKFPKSTDAERNKEMEVQFTDTDKTNAFQTWLDAKIGHLVENKVDISKSTFVHNFYYKV